MNDLKGAQCPRCIMPYIDNIEHRGSSLVSVFRVGADKTRPFTTQDKLEEVDVCYIVIYLRSLTYILG